MKQAFIGLIFSIIGGVAGFYLEKKLSEEKEVTIIRFDVKDILVPLDTAETETPRAEYRIYNSGTVDLFDCILQWDDREIDQFNLPSGQQIEGAEPYFKKLTEPREYETRLTCNCNEASTLEKRTVKVSTMSKIFKFQIERFPEKARDLIKNQTPMEFRHQLSSELIQNSGLSVPVQPGGGSNINGQ